MGRLKKWKPTKDEQVMMGEVRVTVLEVQGRGKVKIRDNYGYKRFVDVSSLSPNSTT